ncbi:HAD family hydrolase [Pararhizobium haloflavum]|uniref:HAD family hydrolase n=1 Tax=Pararhizobium haloflavum TaxID=2037914 RepID=UPI000C1A2F72|nr:HAD family hydrolase [Pararhizobium haloflavum]
MTLRHPHPLVIFDLDGTLVDTGHDLLDSLNHTIGTIGMAPIALSDLDHLVGQGARAMIGRAFALRAAPLSQAENDRLLAVFLDHYEAGMPGKSKPFPGLIDAMALFDAAGFTMAVCTNKTEALSRQLLDALRLTPRFRAIVGGDSLAYRKPDGRHILGTVEKAGGVAERSVMIGDSINDIEAARDAGVRSIGVPFGYTDVPIHDLKPDHVIDHFDQLTPELVLQLLDRQVAC